MKTALLLLALTFASAETATDYRRATPDCVTCREFEKLTTQYANEMSSDQRLQIVLRVAKLIQGLVLHGKPEVAQRREIHFAIDASLQVLPDDFDSETVVRLIDLREKSPKFFDEVFWHFEKGSQQQLVERMRAFKEDKIRPGAVIPPVKDPR